MKLKQLALLIMTTGTVALTACNNQVGSSGASKNVQATNTTDKKLHRVSATSDKNISLSGFTLLSGVLAKSGVIVSSGPAFTADESDTVTFDDPQSTTNVSFSSDTSSLMKTLGINADLKAQANAAAGNLAGSFITDKTSSISSINYYAAKQASRRVTYSKGKYEVGGTVKKFPYENYGDSFINSIRMGIVAAMEISVKSANNKALSALKASLSVTTESGIDLSAGFNSLSQEEQSSISIVISTFQLGGDTKNLTNNLGYEPDPKEPDAGIVDEFSCSPRDLTKCNTLMKNFLQYLGNKNLHGGFIDQESQYLETGVRKYADTHKLTPIDSSDLSKISNGVYTVTTINKNGNPVENSIGYLTPSIERSSALESANLAYRDGLNTLALTIARQNVTYNTRDDIIKYNGKLSSILTQIVNDVTEFCMNPLSAGGGGVKDECIEKIPSITETLINKIDESTSTEIPGFVINGDHAFIYASDPWVLGDPSTAVMAIYTKPVSSLIRRFAPGTTYYLNLTKDSNNFSSTDLTPDSFPFMYNQILPKNVTGGITTKNDQAFSLELDGTWVSGFKDGVESIIQFNGGYRYTKSLNIQ